MTTKDIAQKAKAAVAKNGETGLAVSKKATPQTLKGLSSIDLQDVFSGYELQIRKLLPKHLSPERVLNIFTTLIRRNQDIAACTSGSIIGALLQCAELGFEPTPALQQVAFIPRKNKNNQNRLELEFVVMYQGLIALMYRSGKVSNIRTRVVYENDNFEVTYGDREEITHKPTLSGDRGIPVGVYFIGTLTDGQTIREFMTRDEIEKIRQKSDSKSSSFSPWNNWPEEMWRKAVLRRASKYMPKSIEVSRVLQIDEKVIESTDGILSIEDDPLDPALEISDFTALPEVAEDASQDEPGETEENVPFDPDPSDETAKKATPVQIATLKKALQDHGSKIDKQTAENLKIFVASKDPVYAYAAEWIDFLKAEGYL